MKIVPSAITSTMLVALAAAVHGNDETEIVVGPMRLEGTHALTIEDAEAMGLDGDGGPYMLSTTFLYGGVNVIDVTSGVVSLVVPSVGWLERGGIGVFYEPINEVIIQAGGGPALGLPFSVALYDWKGMSVTTCMPPTDVSPGFFNDIEVKDGSAYITDTLINRLWSFDVAEAAAGNCMLVHQELDEEVFLGTADTPFRANGKQLHSFIRHQERDSSCSIYIYIYI